VRSAFGGSFADPLDCQKTDKPRFAAQNPGKSAMLFTTAQFALIFLPIVLLAFFLIGMRSHLWAAASLFIASVIFYSVSSLPLTALLLASIVFNFFVGTRIGKASQPGAAKAWLIAGLVTDLAALGYFKYSGFIVHDMLGPLVGDFEFDAPTLPVGISFYTFTQIAFLVDTYQKKVKEYRPVHYGLFVTFFPHLVAGPVLHHSQMMPQFADAKTYRFNSANFAAGLAIFLLGLFKKVVIADGISPFADAVFDAARDGHALTLAEGWIGALAYTFQLYFDFSGYSDMAIGLSWMLNIKLPYNFNSPYKALNITDFWRRWHISLSTFLRDYLYIAMGGNRRGKVRRYVNLFITMLLGGLWHGASWTFVFWGALHGVYLMINHAWSAVFPPREWKSPITRAAARSLSWAITFLAVIVGWVFFRATTFDAAQNVLHSMLFGEATLAAERNAVLWNSGLYSGTALTLIMALLAGVLIFQNSNKIGEQLREALTEKPVWRFVSLGSSLVFAGMLVVVNEFRSAVSAFIYFNF
jgi:alginate O-acetyltransferase complex protein AlgI